MVIDCRNASATIGMDIINSAGPDVMQAEFLLFFTGWSAKWGSPDYFEGFPCIDADVADYVVSSGKKGIGIDAISVDPIADVNLPIHRLLLTSGKTVIVENLTNLDKVGNKLFTFYALPLKFDGADGAPVRAIAILA